jgi:hypothetical protein
MKKISITHLFFVSISIVFLSNAMHALAVRPSGAYPNGQPISPFILNSSSPQFRTSSLAVGTSNSVTPGVMFDIIGTLFTNGFIVPANTQINYNLDTTNLTINKLSGTSSTNRELCVSSVGKLIVCP